MGLNNGLQQLTELHGGVGISTVPLAATVSLLHGNRSIATVSLLPC